MRKHILTLRNHKHFSVSGAKNPRRLLVLLALVVAACSSNPTPVQREITRAESTSPQVDELLDKANASTASIAAELRLSAIELLLENGAFERAKRESQAVEASRLESADQITRFAITQARISNSQNDPQSALQILTSGSTVRSADLSTEYRLILGDTYLLLDRPAEAFGSYTGNSSAYKSDDVIQRIHDSAWHALMEIEKAELLELARSASSYASRGWLELARTVNEQELSIKGQLDAIDQWRRVWSSHDAAKILPNSLVKLQQSWEQRPQTVALLLPLQEQAGKAIQEGFLSAYYQSIELNRSTPELVFYDSSGLNNIYPVYDEAIDAGADMVIGPLDKDLVIQLHRLPDLPVPTLALNYVDDSLTQSPQNFFQFGLAPENEIEQAAQLAANLGFKNAALITPNGSDYQRLNSLFDAAWSSTGGSVVSRSTFDNESSYGEIIKESMAIDASEARAEKIKALLPRDRIEFVPRRRQDIDFIYLIASPRQGRQIRPTLAFYFAESLPIIAYPSVYDGSENAEVNKDLDGIVILDGPWLLEQSEPFRNLVSTNLRSTAGPLERLRALGIDSFRLHDRLEQFTQTEIKSLKGTTGLLSLNNNREVYRKLLAARFVDGIPQILPTTSKLSQ